MEIIEQYKNLSDVQRRDISDHVDDAISAIENMRGVNDSATSDIHALLNDMFVDLRDIQDAVWSIDT